MNEKKILEAIEDLKRLLILHLMKSGATSREIRTIFNMSGTNFKKLIPLKKIKKYNLQNNKK